MCSFHFMKKLHALAVSAFGGGVRRPNAMAVPAAAPIRQCDESRGRGTLDRDGIAFSVYSRRNWNAEREQRRLYCVTGAPRVAEPFR
jgi:hypothetical protein